MAKSQVIPKLLQLRLGVLRANGSAELGQCYKIHLFPAELFEHILDLSHVLLLVLLQFGRARDVRQIFYARGCDGAFLARGDERAVLVAQ